MTDPSPETSEPLFDVTVQVPTGARLDEIDRKARAAGVASAGVDALMKMLRSVPEARIGSSVSRERADRAREQFRLAGLNVIVTPVLSLQTKMEVAGDGLTRCLNCNQRVALGPQRQCPECGVFVDKVTEEALLRRRMLEQERARVSYARDRDAREAEKKLRASLEAALREQIREEVEAEFGVGREGRAWGGKWVRGAAFVGLLAAAFGGGMVLQGGGAPSWQAAKAGWSALGTDAQAITGADTAATAAAAAANGGPPTGDVDIDDPLVQAAGGKRIGAKGLTVEQAVAAAQVLAKSVGRGGAAAGPGAGAAQGAASGAAAGTAAAPGVVLTAAGAVGGEPVSAVEKAALTAEFAGRLAELGQLARARALLAALNDSPEAQQPVVEAARRMAAVEVSAWAIEGLSADAARKRVEALSALAAGLPGAGERAAALARAAVILAHVQSSQPDTARAMLSRAAEAIKAIREEPAREAATNAWTVAQGETFVAQARMRARTGQPGRARALAGEVGALVQRATDAQAQARLRALEAQAWHDAGDTARMVKAIDAALMLVAAERDLPRRAEALRAVAESAGDAGYDKLLTAATALQLLVEDRPGAERQAMLVQLALLHAMVGEPVQGERLKALALAEDGALPAEAGAVLARLLVRSDLAAARRAHGYGQYASADIFLRRVADYLL